MRHGCLSSATAALILALALSPAHVASAATSPLLVLSGNGIAVAHLGDDEAHVVSSIEHLLRAPNGVVTRTPQLRNCDVDAMWSWRALSAYFHNGRLVGLSLGPGLSPAGATSAGLRLGDRLSRAQALYGSQLRTSTGQGGTWFVKTRLGPLDGFISPSGPVPSPSSRILTIDVGHVGCPAMSP